MMHKFVLSIVFKSTQIVNIDCYIEIVPHEIAHPMNSKNKTLVTLEHYIYK